MTERGILTQRERRARRFEDGDCVACGLEPRGEGVPRRSLPRAQQRATQEARQPRLAKGPTAHPGNDSPDVQEGSVIKPKVVTIDGVSRTLSQWARQPGAVSRSQISARLHRGVDPKAAVFGRNPNVRHITIAGRTMCAGDWSKCIGARDRHAICLRLDRGEDPIDAVFYDRRYAPKPSVVVPFSVYALRPTWGGVRSITWKAAA